jgi:hypothetical protein
MFKSIVMIETGMSDSTPQGLKGQNIVCFAKDWNEDPTSCNHVLHGLAQSNRVLWVNSISNRSPKLGSARDLRKIFRRVFGFLKGATKVGDQMWLFTPFVLPFHHSRWAIVMNRVILRVTLGVVRWRLGMRRFQLWTFMPTSSEYVGRLGEDLVVYYCTDEWTGFSAVDGKRVGEMVNSLVKRADVVFATQQLLVDKLLPLNPHSFLASHGVKFHMFAAALEADTQIPADLASLPRPVLAYYGLVEEWLDLDLLAYLAERHPEWSIVLIGKTCVDVTKLTRFKNIHLLGRKPHAELPGYCKGFDVAMIPHKVNELTRHMNPIKLREYLSAGVQVVSTDLPEMYRYPEGCMVAKDYAAFEAACQRAIAQDSPAARHARSAPMSRETWEQKVVELGEIVKQVQAERGQRAGANAV